MLMIHVWKLARRSNVVQRLEDLQEDVLGQIFGLVVLADELVGDVEDLPPVLADDRLPRDLIAAEALLDQAVGRGGCAAAESADMRLYRDILHAFVLIRLQSRPALISNATERTVTGFVRQGPALVCDGVPLADLAAAYGTPLYVYSAATIAARYRAIDEAFASYPHAMHYALKANSTLAIARLLRGLGSSADANSGGEIDVALRAGFIPPQIVFTGVGKTPPSWRRRSISASRRSTPSRKASWSASTRSSRERQTRTRRPPRQPRHRRPQPSAHLDRAEDQQVRHRDRRRSASSARRARGRDGVEIVGLHSHVGSQITNLDPLRRAAAALVDLAREAARRRASPSSTSISAAGSACPTTGSPVPTAREYADALLPVVRELGPGDRPRAGPPHRRAGGRAADARRRRQGAGRTAGCS